MAVWQLFSIFKTGGFTTASFLLPEFTCSPLDFFRFSSKNTA